MYCWVTFPRFFSFSFSFSFLFSKNASFSKKRKENTIKNLRIVKKSLDFPFFSKKALAFFEKKGKCKVWNAGPLKNYIKTI